VIEIAIATSLIHPNLFGTAWAILILVCLARLVATWGEGPLSGTGGEALRLWGFAFGPLFLLSAASVWSLGLGVGRIEVLEILAGGAVLALGLSRFKSAAHPRFQFVSLVFHQSMMSRGALIALIAGLLLALYELLIAGERRAGMVFQPINFGIGCGVALLLALFLTEERSRIFVFSMAAGAIALLLSGSRGPILFFVISAGVGLWLGRPTGAKGVIAGPLDASGRTKAWLGAAALLGFVALGVTVAWYRLRFEAVTGEPSSHGIRWELIRLSLAQIAANPWVGVGADQAGKFFSQFDPPVGTLNHAHMTVLNLALELGVLGAAAWIWAFGVLAWIFYRKKSSGAASIGQAGLSVTVFLFLCSMTQDIMSHAYTRKLIALVVVMLLIAFLSALNNTVSCKNPESAPS
jgi:O-antigen ligase